MPSERNRRRRMRTIHRESRGQSQQDFALGVSLFLITASFVLGLFPGFLAPFTSGSGGAEQAQADRVAGSVVLNLSTSDENTLNATALRVMLEKPEAELQKRYGLERTTGINITVRELDGQDIVEIDGQTLATAEGHENQSAAAVGRIITLDNRTVDDREDATKCKPGCRLVVRVW